MTLSPDSRHLGASRGFTLVEIVIAMVIVALSSTAILYAVRISWNSTARSNRILTAGHLLEQEVERVRAYVAQDPQNRFPTVPGLDGTDTTIDDFTLRWKIVHPAPDIHPDPGAPLENVAHARLTALWARPFTDSIVLETYLARDF